MSTFQDIVSHLSGSIPVYLELPPAIRSGYYVSRYDNIFLRTHDGVNKIPIQAGTDNVYDASYRLIAELGLPLPRFAVDRDVSLLVGNGYRAADRWWQENVVQNPYARGREIVAFNGFGGGTSTKGLSIKALRHEVEQVILSGKFVIILPNGAAWATRRAPGRFMRVYPWR